MVTRNEDKIYIVQVLIYQKFIRKIIESTIHEYAAKDKDNIYWLQFYNIRTEIDDKTLNFLIARWFTKQNEKHEL